VAQRGEGDREARRDRRSAPRGAASRGELSAALPEAERRDRELRGQAVAAGKAVEVGEAGKLAAELEDAQQSAKDLEAATEVVARELLDVREANRDTWTQSQDRHVEKARAAVLTAADGLAAAVAKLEDENALRAWAAEPVA